MYQLSTSYTVVVSSSEREVIFNERKRNEQEAVGASVILQNCISAVTNMYKCRNEYDVLEVYAVQYYSSSDDVSQKYRRRNNYVLRYYMLQNR